MKKGSTAMWFMSALIHANIWDIVKYEYIIYCILLIYYIFILNLKFGKKD